MKRFVIILIALALSGTVNAWRHLQDQPITVKELAAALAANPQGDDAIRLADRIRTTFGGRNALVRGLPPKIDETTVAWAIELADPLPPNTARPAVARD